MPRAMNHYGGAESLRGAPKSPNNVHSTFFNSRFASERPQVRTWGRRTCFLPRVPSNFVTPLDGTEKSFPGFASTTLANNSLNHDYVTPVDRLLRSFIFLLWSSEKSSLCDFTKCDLKQTSTSGKGVLSN